MYIILYYFFYLNYFVFKVFSLRLGVGSHPFVLLNDYTSISEAFKNPDIAARNYNIVNDEVIGADGTNDLHF